MTSRPSGGNPVFPRLVSVVLGRLLCTHDSAVATLACGPPIVQIDAKRPNRALLRHGWNENIPFAGSNPGVFGITVEKSPSNSLTLIGYLGYSQQSRKSIFTSFRGPQVLVDSYGRRPFKNPFQGWEGRPEGEAAAELHALSPCKVHWNQRIKGVYTLQRRVVNAPTKTDLNVIPGTQPCP